MMHAAPIAPSAPATVANVAPDEFQPRESSCPCDIIVPIGTDEWLFERTRARAGVGLTSVQILDLLNEVSDNIQGRTICALGDAAAMPVRAMIKHFRDEFAYHIEHKRCQVPAYV